MKPLPLNIPNTESRLKTKAWEALSSNINKQTEEEDGLQSLPLTFPEFAKSDRRVFFRWMSR